MEATCSESWGYAVIKLHPSCEYFFFESNSSPDHGTIEWFGFVRLTTSHKLLAVTEEEVTQLEKELWETSSDRYAEWPAVEAAIGRLKAQIEEWNSHHSS